MATPRPSRFFSTLGETETNGSSDFLDAQQIRMRESKTCGFIEVQVEADVHILFVLAQEALAGTYCLRGNESQPLQLMNLPTVWDGKPAPIRSAALPPMVGRMMWLALEARIIEEADLSVAPGLEERTKRWAEEQFTGAVELFAPQAQGVFYFFQGRPLDSEAFFFNRGAFENLSWEQIQTFGWTNLIVHQPSPASQSQQGLIVRQGALQWGSAVLRRYRELAGQKIVALAEKDLAELVRPWGWNIFIRDSDLRDEHFFSYVQSAAQAYRAVFMQLGSQMEQVVGGSLAQRLMNETFAPLPQPFRSALELHRLIPAAFIG